MAKEIEIMHTYKNILAMVSILHIATKLVSTPTKQPLVTTLIYSSVNGLYNISTGSIKLILDVEQFGTS